MSYDCTTALQHGEQSNTLPLKNNNKTFQPAAPSLRMQRRTLPDSGVPATAAHVRPRRGRWPCLDHASVSPLRFTCSDHHSQDTQGRTSRQGIGAQHPDSGLHLCCGTAWRGLRWGPGMHARQDARPLVAMTGMPRPHSDLRKDPTDRPTEGASAGSSRQTGGYTALATPPSTLLR